MVRVQILVPLVVVVLVELVVEVCVMNSKRLLRVVYVVVGTRRVQPYQRACFDLRRYFRRSLLVVLVQAPQCGVWVLQM